MLWKHRCSTIMDVNYAFRTSEVTSRSQKPSLDWIKANFDGAVGGIDSLVSAGGVIHDDQGRWVYGYARRLGRCSGLMVELWTAHDILLAVWDLGFRQV
ncbi:hypothetical protein V6N12_070438 [Hibiscus sabdariffa]|uniref:RNase H type-1 domain-containing protein n=1 Tax=Hibiscus sabdariffa TaxID=183260 RepID=A0ABR2FGU5_9ROSI